MSTLVLIFSRDRELRFYQLAMVKDGIQLNQNASCCGKVEKFVP